MKVIVISPEASDSREIASVRAMFARGLACYHVRKPSWNASTLSAWLLSYTAEQREKMVLHGHADLVGKLGLGGVHWADERDVPLVPDQKFGLRSRACHDLLAVRRSLGHFETVLLSPVFPSISKPGYGMTRSWTDRDVTGLLQGRNAVERSTAVLALGGIDESTTRHARAMGFDGVAVLGAIWLSGDPVNAFERISAACQIRSAEKSEATLAARTGALANLR